ncbi:21161_t:CDS:2, partial [Entrophospora sp. SA101]
GILHSRTIDTTELAEENSKFYQNIESFYQESVAKYGPNEATKYHPHISMTGFFTLKSFIPSSSQSKDNKSVITIYQQLDSIINF